MLLSNHLLDIQSLLCIWGWFQQITTHCWYQPNGLVAQWQSITAEYMEVSGSSPSLVMSFMPECRDHIWFPLSLRGSGYRSSTVLYNYELFVSHTSQGQLICWNSSHFMRLMCDNMSVIKHPQYPIIHVEFLSWQTCYLKWAHPLWISDS